MSEPEKSTFAVILAAAGKSTRFSKREAADPAVKKTFAQLGGKPVWLRSVEKFVGRSDVIQIVVVVSPDDIGWFRKYYLPEINRMLLQVTAGGETRTDSIRNGLNAVTPRADFVAIHDAARPCVTAQEVESVFRAAKLHGAALLAAPVVDTIKKVIDGQVKTTVPRENLWEAQTPQVFRREMLLEAYRQKIKGVPTDDSQLVEQLGRPVTVVPSDSGNIKITAPFDMILAKYLIEQGR